jgi:hypothetical protein
MSGGKSKYQAAASNFPRAGKPLSLLDVTIVATGEAEVLGCAYLLWVNGGHPNRRLQCLLLILS